MLRLSHCATEAFLTVREALALLAQRDLAPPFTLGVELELRVGALVVARVAPGSGARRTGLRPGGALTRIGGEPVGSDPLALLLPYLERGRPVPLEVRRDGRPLWIEVTPRARE